MQPVPQTKPRKSPVREYLETLIGAAILAVLIMTFVARAFTVNGPSMLPTLEDGQRLLVDRITYRIQAPQRGDVVIFRYPFNPKEHFIKRIIGVPGDEVRIVAGTVYVNGVALQESYLNGQMLPRNFGPITVTEDTYFVLGDNRNNSEDSRDRRVGLVPRKNLIGRAIWRYWPLGDMSVFRIPESFESVPVGAGP